jgi:polar amino acid transport system substrate-binding protein
MTVRRTLAAAMAAGLVLAGCGGGSKGPEGVGTPSASASGAATATECAAGATMYKEGQLTIATSNPAFPPYFAGGETKKHKEWQLDDPYAKKGFEDAVAYEVAARLGFTDDQVVWKAVPFSQSYKPGAKNWDLSIQQIAYNDKRATKVDFSDSYYEVVQALVAVKDTPIASATSIADLKPYSLAAEIGTTNYDFIVATIKPDKEVGTFNSTSDAVAALNAGSIDGIVVDLPTALYMTDPFVQEVENGVTVGQFSSTTGEHFGMTFEKGNPLRDCVNLALSEMTADGALQSITTEWLSEKTNVGEVPVLSS